MAVPRLLYGSETCTVISNQIKRSEATEIRFLRRGLGDSLLDYIRSYTIRQKLGVDDVKGYTEQWMNHVNRMDEDRIPRIMCGTIRR